MPRSTVTTRTAPRHLGGGHPHDARRGRLRGRSPSSRARRQRRRSAAARGRAARRRPAATPRRGGRAARLASVTVGSLAAAAVARRARVGARRARPHAERAAGVAPGDRSAARAHGVHVHHRQRQRAAAHLAARAPPPRRRRAPPRRRTRCRPCRAPRRRPRAGARGHPGRAHRAARPGRRARSRRRGARPWPRRRRRRSRASPRARAGPPARQRSIEPLEVAAQERREGRVHHGGGAALVLAEHARRSRARWTRARPGGPRSTSAAARRSWSGWRKPQSRHTAAASNVEAVERARPAHPRRASRSTPSGPVRSGTGTRSSDGHERRRVGGAEPVELGARLAAQLLEVGEALGGEQRGARHPALEQRVGGHGHPVHEALDVPGRARRPRRAPRPPPAARPRTGRPGWWGPWP